MLLLLLLVLLILPLLLLVCTRLRTIPRVLPAAGSFFPAERSRQSLEPTQIPTQFVPAAFPLGVRRTFGVKLTTHSCLVSSLGMSGARPTTLTCLHIEHRDKLASILLKLMALYLLLLLLDLILSSSSSSSSPWCSLWIVSFVDILLLQFLSSLVLFFFPSPLIRWASLSLYSVNVRL